MYVHFYNSGRQEHILSALKDFFSCLLLDTISIKRKVFCVSSNFYKRTEQNYSFFGHRAESSTKKVSTEGHWIMSVCWGADELNSCLCQLAYSKTVSLYVDSLQVIVHGSSFNLLTHKEEKG